MVIADPGTVAGRKLAAGVADVVLVNCSTAEAARDIRRTMRSLAAAAQRDPDTLRVLLNVFPILGSTAAEARRAESDLRQAVDPTLALALLQSRLGAPSAAADGPVLDGVALSDLWPPERIAADGLSPDMPVVAAGRDVAARMAGLPFVGTPEELAGRLAELHAAQCCDGFNLVPAILPDGLTLLVERTIPLLRAKKLVPGQLSGATLRDRLGLAHPRSRYASDGQTG
jgi:alkanesulfonate monooxygenase SsuD/methylene tetrahydromethanopterin reductase-like flavin-dependent oxidoreductase (luciferase family)